MKEILKEHGNAITAFAVVVVIFGILFGTDMITGVFKIGNIEKSMDYTGYADTLRQVVSEAVPEIRFNAAAVIYENTEIDLRTFFYVKYATEEDYIQAVDISQENFQVKSIQNQRNEELISQYHPDSGKIIFQEAGMYEIELCVKDNEQRKTRVTFHIPVENIYSSDIEFKSAQV